MRFVMVPVPEQFVHDVMRHIVRLQARDTLKPWDQEAMEAFFSGSLNDGERSLLLNVADAAGEGETRPLQDLAAALDTGMGGLLEICQALGDKASEAGRVTPAESTLKAAEAGSGVVEGEQVRVMRMDREVASMVHEAHKLSLASQPA